MGNCFSSEESRESERLQRQRVAQWAAEQRRQEIQLKERRRLQEWNRLTEETRRIEEENIRQQERQRAELWATELEERDRLIEERRRIEEENIRQRRARLPEPSVLHVRGNILYNSLMRSQLTNNWEFTGDNESLLRFVTVDKYTSEYRNINSLFRNTTKRHVLIHEIERIENHFLLAAYLLKKEELTTRNGFVPDEQMLFHGTKEENIQSICKDNFDWRRYGYNKGNKFGKGVSFSPISFYATHYGDTNSYYKVMLLAYVLVGNSIVGNANDRLPPAGYDTTTKDNGHVVVKFEDNEFYPMYKITYYCNPV